ncbi:hypothetical protein ACMYUJ_17200 [Stutzerimonas zhaodongensis]|uniref:hypothetical protein n=1 Tax=Stutzerimonas zhaodongensis TaxID=1176257 RepID=UPI0039EE11BD
MDKMCTIYKGASSDELRISIYDGRNWSLNEKIKSRDGNIEPKSDKSPAICLLNNNIYLVYKGSGNSDIFVARFDGDEWSGDKKVGEFPGGISPKTTDDPASVVFNGIMYVFYKGANSSRNIFFATYDGALWRGDTKITVTLASGKMREPKTNHAVDAAVHDGKIWIIYKADDGKDLFWITFDGTTWRGDERVRESGDIDPKTEGTNPGLVSFKDKLFAFYRGAGNRNIFYLWYDGAVRKWGGDVKIPLSSTPMTTQAPRAIVFKDKLWLIYKGEGSNELFYITYDGTNWSGNEKIKVDGSVIESDNGPELCWLPAPRLARTNWLQGVADSTRISDINLPGTHDSAALNTGTSEGASSWWKTPWAAHNLSLTDQFRLGVRVFDLRIRISENSGRFLFMTCHGRSKVGEYQTLASALAEFRQCVVSYKSEFLVIFLRIDDYAAGEGQKDAAIDQLAGFFSDSIFHKSRTIPAVGQVRGSIFLINGLNAARFTNVNGRLGATLNWKDEDGFDGIIPNSTDREYSVYLQDRWKQPKNEKLNTFINVVNEQNKARTADVLLNFASSNYYLMGTYIQEPLIRMWGESLGAERPKFLGWSLWDYENITLRLSGDQNIDMVGYIIDSNYNFSNYPERFSILDDGKDEL